MLPYSQSHTGNDRKSKHRSKSQRAAQGESSTSEELKMDLEPVGPNHEARRDCPIQQQGIRDFFRRTPRVPDGDNRKKQSGNTVFNRLSLREAFFISETKAGSPQQGFKSRIEIVKAESYLQTANQIQLMKRESGTYFKAYGIIRKYKRRRFPFYAPPPPRQPRYSRGPDNPDSKVFKLFI